MYLVFGRGDAKVSSSPINNMKTINRAFVTFDVEYKDGTKERLTWNAYSLYGSNVVEGDNINLNLDVEIKSL